MILKFVLVCLKLLAFVFPFEILVSVPCLLLVAHIKVALQQHAQQSQMPFSKTLTCLKDNCFFFFPEGGVGLVPKRG
jgi:hypothetical protein